MKHTFHLKRREAPFSFYQRLKKEHQIVVSYNETAGLKNYFVRPGGKRDFALFFSKKYRDEVMAVVFVILLGGVFMTASATQRASMPIPYQGRLLDSNYATVADGTYNMKFAIYDSLAATTGCQWMTGDSSGSTNCTNRNGVTFEPPTSPVTATVSRGLFTKLLGDATSANPEFTAALQSGSSYLEVWICETSGGGCSTYQKLSPRKQLGGVPYAYNSDELDGWDPATGISGGMTLTGGTGTTDDLTLQSTSGVGATGATILLKVGSNGGTTALTINNDGTSTFGSNAVGMGALTATTGTFSAAAAATGLTVSGTGATGIYVTRTGTGANNYAIDAEATGAGTSNYGGYFVAANATNNYALYIPTNYPPVGDNNYAIRSLSVAKSVFSGPVTTAALTATTGTFSGNVASGSGIANVNIIANGLNSGTAGGGTVIAQVAGVTTVAIGNKSALVGGDYDATPWIYSSGTLHLAPAGVTKANLDTSGNLTISAGLTATTGAFSSALSQVGTASFSAAVGTGIANGGNVDFKDTTALGANNGGSIQFSAVYTGSSLTNLASIKAYKDNATDGEYGGGLALGTRTHGSSIAERMRITSAGYVGIGKTPDTMLDVYNPLLAATAINSTNAHINLSTQNNGTLQQTAIYFNSFNTTGNSSPASIANIAAGNTASNLVFSTNPDGNYVATTTERMRIDSAGNVGIGTASPDSGYKISLQEATSHSAAISFKDTDGTQYGEFGMARTTNDIITGSANLEMVFAAAADLILASGGVERMRIVDTTGYVGIGTTPSYPLDVNGQMRAERYRGINSLVLASYATVNPASNVYLYSPGNDRDSWVYLDSADTGSNWGIYHRQIDSTVSDIPANSIAFVGGGSSAANAYIDLNDGDAFFRGAVGIGTATPSIDLHLSSGSGSAEANRNFGIHIDTTGSTEATNNEYSYIQFSTPTYKDGAATEGLEIGMSESSQVAYFSRTQGSGSTTNGFVIDGSGYIGIGTVTPSVKLHVVGSSILANGTSIDPDSYANTVIAGTVADGSGWSATSALGGNAGTGDSWTLGHNGSYFEMGIGDGTNANSLFSLLKATPSTTAASRKIELLLAGGNVGIGATANYAKLVINQGSAASGNTSGVAVGRANDVATGSTGYGNLYLFSTDAVAADIGGTISLGGIYTDTGSVDTRYAVIQGAKENATDAQYGGYLRFFTRANGATPTEKLRIDSAGQIGIATTTPGTSSLADTSAGPILNIGGTIPQIIFNASTSTQESRIGSGGDGLYFDIAGHATASNNKFVWRTVNTDSSYSYAEIMRLDSTGNLALGLPGSSTTSIGTGYTTADIRGTNGGGILIGKISAQRAHFYADAGGAYLGPYDDIPLNLQQNNATVLTLDADGEVGIGTTSPSEKLSLSYGSFLISAGNTISNAGTVAVSNSVMGVAANGKYVAAIKYTDAGTCSGTTVTGCEFVMYDASNPASPSALGGIDLARVPYGVHVYGKYAYIAMAANAGGTCSGATVSGCELIVVDISNPSSPTTIGGLNLTTDIKAITISGKYAYVGQSANASTCSGTTIDGCEFAIIDISNPISPTAVSGINTASVVNAVAIHGRYAYFGQNNIAGTCSGATVTGCELVAVDISNPTTPTATSGIDYSTYNQSVKAVQVNGGYAYVGLSSDATGDEFKIVSISAPSALAGVGSLDTGTVTYNSVNAIALAEGYAYLALDDRNSNTCSSSNTSGCEILIVDIKTAASPSAVGGLSLSAIGATSIVAYGKNLYYGSTSALSIATLQNIDAPSARIGTISTNSIEVLGGGRFAGSLFTSGLNVGTSGIYSQGPLSINSLTTGTANAAIDTRNSAGTSLLYVRDDGNVGIGTTTPGQLLQVGDGTQVTPILKISGETVNNSSEDITSALWVGTQAYGNVNDGDNIAWKLARTRLTTDYDGRFSIYSVNRSGTSEVDAERFSILLNGNIGIGITTPQSPLHIYGSTGYGSLKISPTSANGEASMGFTADTAGTDGNDIWTIGASGWSNTGDFVIGNENNGAGGNVRLLIEKDGDIGIGTTTPEALLNLNTSAYATDAAILLSTGGDARGRIIGSDGSSGKGILGFDVTTAQGTPDTFTRMMTITSTGAGIGTVGDSTYNYLQIDTQAGDPTSGDCNEASEAGRMIFDTTGGAEQLWICNGTTGWIYFNKN